MRKMRTLTPRSSRPWHSRLALLAILAFVLLSATLALATAILPDAPERRRPLSATGPVVHRAEAATQHVLDDRIHMHLKRLAALP